MNKVVDGRAGRPASNEAARHGTGEADLTVMLAAHNAFRRDLRKLATAASQARSWSPERQSAVLAGWEVFQRQLHVHHQGEDRTIWPLLHARLDGSGAATSVLDAMQAEHERIDPLLEAVDLAFGFRAGSGDRSLPAAADAAAELATQLSRHLTHEERDALPLIGQALTAREWRDAGRTMGRQAGVGVSFVPEFFGWLLDGAAPDKRAVVLATLPAVMRPLVANVFRPLYARRDSW
jgi:iron-sulfur cluster repair protein YtfE (RIC family)